MTKSLLGKDSFLRSSLNYLPSPATDGESDDDAVQLHSDFDIAKAQKFREDVLLDFANLESSFIRTQLILSSNQRERERYAAEKARILETAQAVRDNTAELRVRLIEAESVLELRKGYDLLAAKILDDKKLKSRDESRADIEKLEKEIEDLQHESGDYEGTWVTRREQFDRMVREGEAMIRLIKGIKEDPEPDKDEAMDEGEKADASRADSPAPDGRSPRPMDAGDGTPLPESGEAGSSTPARLSNRLLDIDETTRTNSRVSSPLIPALEPQDDVEMTESLTVPQTQAREEASTEPTNAAALAPEATETMDET